MRLFLRVIDGHLPAQVFRLEDPSRLRVGRRLDCDIPLQDRSVSRLHCVLDVSADRIVVTDILSRNGVWLNSSRLTAPGVARRSATIRLAGVSIYVLRIHDFSFDLPPLYGSPRDIIGYLPGQGSSRKLRLIACAWYRHVIGDCPCARLRRLTELAEQHADGLVSASALAREHDEGQALLASNALVPSHEYGPVCLTAAAAREAAESMLNALSGFAERDDVANVMSALARDVLGDFFHPFHPTKEMLAWNEGTLLKMARTIYESRDFSAMPVLGDALEDAGCCETEVLQHCRAEQVHTRGCWVLDSILDTAQSRALEPGPEVTMAGA